MFLKSYVFYDIIIIMNWKIIFQENFDAEFDELNESVQDECYAHLKSSSNRCC